MPSVVVGSQDVSLGDVLDLKNLPLATTPGGKAFVIKALHPSDSEFKAPRGPGSVVPTTAIASDQLVNIPVPTTAKFALAVQTANPWMGLTVYFYADETQFFGNPIEIWQIQNAALGGGTVKWSAGQAVPTLKSLTDNVQVIQDNFEKYRVVAQSITVEYLAPATADQGSITSCQYVEAPATFSGSSYELSGTAWDKFHLVGDLHVYEYPPSLDKYLMGTSAYTSKIRDGVYQPLRLEKFKWHTADDCMIPMNFPADLTVHNQHQLETKNAGLMYYPWHFTMAGFDPTAAYCFPKCTSDVIGLTLFSGMAAAGGDVTLRFRYRQNLEVVPVLGTVFASMSEAPLPPDDTAYRMYREISGRMKDAYPASYNDWGKLKEVIKSIGKKVLPAVDPALSLITKMVPEAAPFTSLASAGLKTYNALKAQADKLPDTVPVAVPVPPKGTGVVVQGTRAANYYRKPRKPRNRRGQSAPPPQGSRGRSRGRGRGRSRAPRGAADPRAPSPYR